MLKVYQPNEKCKSFVNYLYENYISLSSKFPPSMWAKSLSHGRDVRTTNGAEGFHSSYNSNFNKSKPNIYRVVNVLQEIQTETYCKLRSIDNSQINRQSRQLKRSELQIQRAWSTFINSQQSDTDLLNFLLAAGHRLQGKKLRKKKAN